MSHFDRCVVVSSRLGNKQMLYVVQYRTASYTLRIPNGRIHQRNSIETIVENKKRNEMEVCCVFKRFCAQSRIVRDKGQSTFLE